METACSWLLETLDAEQPYPLCTVRQRHLDRNDSFDLSDVLSFLPEKTLPSFVGLVQQRLEPTLSFLRTHAEHSEDDSETYHSHRGTALAASEISWLLVHQRKQAVPNVRPLIYSLHDAFLDMPSEAQNKISTMCATLWHSGDSGRGRVVPFTILHFLQKSFGEEAGPRNPKSRHQFAGTVADVHRVYTMRKALETLELAETAQNAKTIRNLLMRCATSSVYLKTSEGRKFLAYLLTLSEVKDSTFDTLLNHLATVRKSSANLFGAVLLHAWKLKREEWLAERLKYLSEKAIQAGAEPFATNLRAILSSLHANKRVTGVDLLLNNMYRPVIFGKLMVANPLVRRNAILVLADAFPVYDPGAGVQDIEEAIESQCNRFLELLKDPCCSVRLAAIEGACRVLGLFWEIVSPSFAKQVVDVLTSQLAFDMSSPRIRMTVCEGLKFMVENHLTHQILAVALPRISSVVHDRVERVRLAFLDLLLTVKSKRIRSLRYFDIVQVQELLLRLPIESPAVAAKIMDIIRTAYFPLERKQKTVEELAASQTRACLSMLGTNRDAAYYFYKHLYLHVPPGPLLEFTMRLSLIAVKLNKSSINTPNQAKGSKRKKAQKQQKQKQISKQKETKSTAAGDENKPPSNSTDARIHKGSNPLDSEDDTLDLESVLLTVSEVLVSISTSLRKESNRSLQEYLETIFEGDALRTFLLEKRSSLSIRASGWRIASCLPVSKVNPLIVLWKQQIESVPDWNAHRPMELQGRKDLLSALLLCGLKWNLSSFLSSLFATWCDGAVNGNRITGMGTKTMRRSQLKDDRRSRSSSAETQYAVNASHDRSTRGKFLSSLWLCGDVVLNSQDLYDRFIRLATISGRQQQDEEGCLMFSYLRRACTGSLDFFLDTDLSSSEPMESNSFWSPRFLLRALTTAFRASLKFAAEGTAELQPLTEIRQLFQWLATQNVWKRAFSANNQFAIALAAICLGHAADAVAVTCMNVEDLLRYEEIVKQIHQEVSSSGGRATGQLLADGFRLALLIREQALDGDVDGASNVFCAAEQLRETSNSCLSKFSEILNCVKQASQQGDNRRNRYSRCESFLGDIMIDIMSCSDMRDFRSAFSDTLTAEFGVEDMADCGMFSFIVCKIITSLIMSKKESGPKRGLNLYSYIVKCFRHLDGPTGDKCVANFTRELVDVLFSQCSEGEKKKIPSASAKQCFAAIASTLSKEFPQLDAASEMEERCIAVAREAEKVLGLLVNMGERDALENRELVQA